ncbi:MAG TPA: 3-oxoacyl-[acyl-carrier-protein] synthase III C-terminal domain-containing protein [Polyangiaceae bacterium]|jgi:predicted naringenin-chalcone synthase
MTRALTSIAALAAKAHRLVDFRSVRPSHEAPQGDTLDWLARLHADAERAASPDPAAFDVEAFAVRMRKLLQRCGCSPEKIATRGYEIASGPHEVWTDLSVYDVTGQPNGAGSSVRTELFARAAEAAVDRLYAEEDDPPGDLIHVTCTGYTSPSAAQRLVARRGWGKQTRVTHAYHMGCYASLPALRIARGFLAQGGGAFARPSASPRVDVVHNEMCTLHLHPAEHTLEQLVVQSLFADGHIRYSFVPPGERDRPAPGLAVLSAREEILSESGASMTWQVSDHGMNMSLARDVPERIAQVARAFVVTLFEDAEIDIGHISDTVFAIHPGGPKVIDVMQRALELSDAQVKESRAVLLRYGNMSSATLPHIWMRLAADRDVEPGTPIVSLAFGPGLTVSGSLMAKT